jgi:hypothetical protein
MLISKIVPLIMEFTYRELVITRKVTVAIMHDGTEVVFEFASDVPVFVELVFKLWFNVRPPDLHVVISIKPILLVHQTDGGFQDQVDDECIMTRDMPRTVLRTRHGRGQGHAKDMPRTCQG